MTLLEKLETIDSPAVHTLYNSTANGIDAFWNKIVLPYLPKRETVLQWHDLLMRYIKTDHPTFAIRGYNSFPPEQYSDLRRGFLTDTQEFSFFYTDNFFAFYIQKMCLDGFVPTVEELVSAFNNRQFPSRFGRNTAEERELLAVKQGKDPKISAAGFKLAHILPVGKEYLNNDRLLGSKEILEYYFPKGERNDWKTVHDKTGCYHKRQLHAKSEAKRYAIAHFLRFVHPFNYFLCPKKDYECNDKCRELAEYAPLLNYAHDYMLKTFGDAYREFLSYCMPDARHSSLLFDAAKNNIYIQIGGIMNEQNQRIQEIRHDFQQLNIKDLIVEHYNGQYTAEEIREALSPFQIKVELINLGTVIGEGDNRRHAGGDKNPKINDGIGKKKAIALFYQSGYHFCRHITFASKTGPDYYWANPKIEFLHGDWDLIANDWINKKLYLFRIPANAMHLSQIKTRSDQPNKIDLQIQYNDPTFTDKRSGVSFGPFFIKELDYAEHIQHKMN